jgi:epsin
MFILEKGLNDRGTNWRHVLKSLKVLDYCLHHGSELVVTWTRKNIHILKTLREFSYLDEDGRDVGANVRLSAKELVSLVLDEDRLRAERSDRRRSRSPLPLFTKKAPISHLNEGMGNPITNVLIRKPVNKDVLKVELLDQKLKDEHYHVAQRNPEFVDAELRLALEVSKREADLHAAREASKIEDGQPEQEDGEHPFPAPNRTPITDFYVRVIFPLKSHLRQKTRLVQKLQERI